MVSVSPLTTSMGGQTKEDKRNGGQEKEKLFPIAILDKIWLLLPLNHLNKTLEL